MAALGSGGSAARWKLSTGGAGYLAKRLSVKCGVDEPSPEAWEYHQMGWLTALQLPVQAA